MFTTIMYGFINEVTRQPGSADLGLHAGRADGRSRAAARARIRRVAAARKPEPLHGQYTVLADSFKRAAGFH